MIRLPFGSPPGLLCAVAFCIAGLLILAFPQQLLMRMSGLEGHIADSAWLMYAYGLGFISIAAALALEAGKYTSWLLYTGFIALLGAVYVCFTLHISDWWIDDAGITFSYSRSLAEGHGITFQPGATPTEGYSSSLWMLLLAAMGASGWDIPTAAKSLGVLFGLTIVFLSFRIVWTHTQSEMALLVTLCAISVAPFVVWTASGQEHAMQGLLMLLAVVAAAGMQAWRLPVALILSLLVLTRPEAPLIVMSVFAMALGRSYLRDGTLDILRNLPLALIPFLTFVALMIWRVSYFGDPLPNPFYAKASVSSFSGLLNPLGGGWRYVLDALRDSALLLLVPLAFLLPRGRLFAGSAVLFAVLAGHMVFVLWAKGDWMGQYRFLMPIVALLVLPAVIALPRIASRTARMALCTTASLIFLTTTVTALDRFGARPTTPLAVVSEVGATFARLARMMEIEDPLLAHHDAGGISYDREIRLVDLGGLVNRDIAKNMRNRTFLETYIFEERQPDFIFGAINFAARSGFTKAPAFARDYVPLIFQDQPVMDSTLSHIRRERIKEAAGVEIIKNAEGRVTQVIMLKPET